MKRISETSGVRAIPGSAIGTPEPESPAKAGLAYRSAGRRRGVERRLRGGLWMRSPSGSPARVDHVEHVPNDGSLPAVCVIVTGCARSRRPRSRSAGRVWFRRWSDADEPRVPGGVGDGTVECLGQRRGRDHSGRGRPTRGTGRGTPAPRTTGRVRPRRWHGCREPWRGDCRRRSSPGVTAALSSGRVVAARPTRPSTPSAGPRRSAFSRRPAGDRRFMAAGAVTTAAAPGSSPLAPPGRAAPRRNSRS